MTKSFHEIPLFLFSGCATNPDGDVIVVCIGDIEEVETIGEGVSVGIFSGGGTTLFCIGCIGGGAGVVFAIGMGISLGGSGAMDAVDAGGIDEPITRSYASLSFGSSVVATLGSILLS